MGTAEAEYKVSGLTDCVCFAFRIKKNIWTSAGQVSKTDVQPVQCVFPTRMSILCTLHTLHILYNICNILHIYTLLDR